MPSPPVPLPSVGNGQPWLPLHWAHHTLTDCCEPDLAPATAEAAVTKAETLSGRCRLSRGHQQHADVSNGVVTETPGPPALPLLRVPAVCPSPTAALVWTVYELRLASGKGTGGKEGGGWRTLDMRGLHFCAGWMGSEVGEGTGQECQRSLLSVPGGACPVSSWGSGSVSSLPLPCCLHMLCSFWAPTCRRPRLP